MSKGDCSVANPTCKANAVRVCVSASNLYHESQQKNACSKSAHNDDDDIDHDTDGNVGRNDKQCKALGGLPSNAMQCKAMQSNVQQRRALLMQRKAMQSKAMQDSVSQGKRKTPNWGRAGFIVKFRKVQDSVPNRPKGN